MMEQETEKIMRRLWKKQNPFKSYKQALKFLFNDYQKKMMLSKYEPTIFDWAILTLFKSDYVMQNIMKYKVRGKI